MEKECGISYHVITEAPGMSATREQAGRLLQRYRFARSFCEGRDVLEMACGCGLGLGYLAKAARSVVGIDIDRQNVAMAKARYEAPSGTLPIEPEKIDIQLMDAERPSFPDGTFDVILLFEAIYYLPDPEQCIRETARLLRNGGVFIVGTVNKDWDDLHRSPHTHRYFSVPELNSVLKKYFPKVSFYGGFSSQKTGIRDMAISGIKKIATRLSLIPGSLNARAYLKRIFLGRMAPLPSEIYDGMAPYEDPVGISSEQTCRDYKIVYAIARNC